MSAVDARSDLRIPGQLSIFHELARGDEAFTPTQQRFIAGLNSYLTTSDDGRVIKVGSVARREHRSAQLRRRPRMEAFWRLVLNAAVDEYLRRHPEFEGRM